MPKYLIKWEDSVWYNLEIEADSHKAALDIWHNQEYDSEDIIHTGSELQDSIEIEEV